MRERKKEREREIEREAEMAEMAEREQKKINQNIWTKTKKAEFINIWTILVPLPCLW